MELEVVKTALVVINMLGTLAIGVWLYLEKRNDKTNARIDEAEKTIEVHGTQLAKLEEASEHAPTHGDLGDLHQRVTEVANSMNNLAGEFSGVKNVLNLIHQHLLNGGKAS